MRGLRCLALLTVFWLAPAGACINGYTGEIMTLMGIRKEPKALAEQVAKFEEAYWLQPSLERANDLAVAFIIAGDYPRAIRILRGIEAQRPGISRTASNLGTALELAGNDAEALKWIREGLVRDPADHEGTEWLHVKILEAKLALAKDPHWLDTHSVIGVSFGDRESPHLPVVPVRDFQGRERSMEDVGKALAYQLHERARFVDPPDAVVADLFQSWGALAKARGDFEADNYFRGASMYTAQPDPDAGKPLRDVDVDLRWAVLIGFILLAWASAWWFNRRKLRPALPDADA